MTHVVFYTFCINQWNLVAHYTARYKIYRHIFYGIYKCVESRPPWKMKNYVIYVVKLPQICPRLLSPYGLGISWFREFYFFLGMNFLWTFNSDPLPRKWKNFLDPYMYSKHAKVRVSLKNKRMRSVSAFLLQYSWKDIQFFPCRK